MGDKVVVVLRHPSVQNGAKGCKCRKEGDAAAAAAAAGWEVGVCTKLEATKHQAPRNKYQVPSTKHQVQSTKYKAPSTKLEATELEIAQCTHKRWNAFWQLHLSENIVYSRIILVWKD